MKYEDLKKINETLKTTDIKGKDYVEVNQRILAFRELFENGSIETEIVEMADGIITIKAIVKDSGVIVATGLAQEKEGSTFINKTSYVENCETSAVGRALGMLGIGATTSIASAEEVKNAIANQNKEVEDIREKLIDTIKISALTKAVEEYKISDDKVVAVLKEYGYYATNQILVKDYKAICDELGKLKEVK